MKKLAIIVGLSLLSAGFILAQSEPRLAEMRSSRGIEPKTQAPVDIAETFSTEAKPIYMTVKLIDGVPGTKVKFVVKSGDGAQIAAYEFPDASGTGYLSFKVSPPASGWPVGRYKVFFLLNGKEHGSIGFAVTAPAAGTPAGQAATKTFVSRKHGFSIQYPAGWVEGERGAESVACMYLSNPANNPIASLNVQVIPVTGVQPGQEKEAVNLVAKQFIDQIKGSPGGRIRGDTWATAGGNSGRELDSEYTYEGKNVRQRMFMTFNSNKVFAVILTVEANIYQANSGYYLQATKSLSFAGD